VDDCAVVGIPDEEWGELIVAALVVKETSFETNTLQPWLREKIAAYKTPRKYLVLPELPRNAMGKVVKSSIKQLFT
jgi:malonyl-CoA/methylmalonyl-CoA synthetase